MTDAEFLQQIKDELPYENSAMQGCMNRLLAMVEERDREIERLEQELRKKPDFKRPPDWT